LWAIQLRLDPGQEGEAAQLTATPAAQGGGVGREKRGEEQERQGLNRVAMAAGEHAQPDSIKALGSKRVT